ncbi:MAG: LicD family protein [Lachnospiraceae bacterium]|nr:LicD family protein [Lachnospiraceae bacterium]
MIELKDEMLHKLQMIELEMLLEVDRICKKCKIKYTIIGGTLLGAVRHGGFIPWDDDADVAMLRPEFDKFCHIVEKELDHSRFYFQSMDNTEGYRWGYAKIRRKETLFLRENQEHMRYEQGVFLDIFPIDGTPDNIVLRRIHDFCCFCVRKILWSAVGRKTASNKFERLTYKLLYLIPEKVVRKVYKGLIIKKNGNSTEVVRTLTFPAPKKLHGYYRKWFVETAPISFEGKQFEGVKDYHGWLSYEFGDYMDIPPEEKRKAHPVSEIRLIDVEII